jgi:hypothetical protein
MLVICPNCRQGAAADPRSAGRPLPCSHCGGTIPPQPTEFLLRDIRAACRGTYTACRFLAYVVLGLVILNLLGALFAFLPRS